MKKNHLKFEGNLGVKWFLMGFYGDVMGFNGDIMGCQIHLIGY